MEVTPERAGVSRALHHAVRVVGLPPQTSPKTAFFPAPAVLRCRARPRISRGAILVAAVLLCAPAVSWGYFTGSNSNGSPRGYVMQLVGAAAAPNASASLRIGVADAAGNRPLELAVSGLRQVPGYYTLFLVERGGPRRSCGAFHASKSSAPTMVRLSVPYRLSAGDTWIVTQETAAQPELGTTVLRGIQTAHAPPQAG
jgi:hypothetical protein